MVAEIVQVAESFRAMNTSIELLIYPELGQVKPALNNIVIRKAERAAARIKDLFANTENSLSRFLEDSELSQLNREGFIENASPALYHSVFEAIEMANLTGGVFDPTILKALVAAGYGGSFELIGQGDNQLSVVARNSLPTVKGYQGIRLNLARKAILLPHNTQIDLGGIAKGMTVDRAARLLKKEGYSHFMVSAGGDMYLSGNHVGTSKGWRVNVLNPISMEGNIAQAQVFNQAVATSAVTRRRWMINKEVKNHLIDPRSGDSVKNELAAVTVVAPTTRMADVMAKTALILGLKEGQEFIEKQPGCTALFITKELQLIAGKGFPIIKE